MKKILLDTNFLLIPARFSLDIFSEIDRIILEKHELYVLDKTIEELKKIIKDKEQKLKDRRAANLGLQLVGSKDINIINSEDQRNADEIIIDLEGYTVATQDKELRSRLRQKGTRVISMRGKNRLVKV